MNRYWKFFEVNELTLEVAGEGVVGEQPTLNPNQRYTYTSGAIIAQPPATMEGHYEFKNAEGHCFKVPIPAFVLSIPGQIH
ncbi:MAG: ApaG domain, partial [Saprospiraceae bacterium]|nr:ApaG domain [Saprospiraceae bacterium]